MALRNHRVLILSGMLGTSILSSCNFYAPVDKPSGDAQVLSAARACFDKGDYSCASKYYSQLSAASSDQSNSESAYETLAQNGATAGVFINAVVAGSSSGGKLLTKLAEALTSNAGETARLAFFHAYQKYPQIVDTKAQGLVQFITSFTIAAEILAEAASAPGLLKQTDIVANPVQCLASAPLYGTGCNAPTGTKLTTGTAFPSLIQATDQQMSGGPTLTMLNAALNEADTGIKKMQTSGSIGSSASDFTQGVRDIATQSLVSGTDATIFRATLIKYNVGE